MSEFKHACALLSMAEKDFRALEGMRDAATFADEIFGFHAQQAVEKTLKAWIAAQGQEYPLTHNLARLLAILEDEGAQVEDFWDLTEYTAFAVEFRYGSLDMSQEPLNRPVVVSQVARLIERVKGLMEGYGEQG
jgi:HEPN domain-containing protein